jgi:ATP-dependent RNA helicase RhlE
MALTEDERALLADLQRREAEPDEGDDFEIEIFDGQRGARIPFKQGARWLRDNFGIGLAELAEGDGGQGQGQGQQQGQGQGQQRQGQGQGQQQPARQGYFSKRAAQQ